MNSPSTPTKTSPSGEWTTPTRTRVLDRLALGHSKKKISRDTGVPRATVQRWAQSGHTRRTGSSRPGRPHLLTQRDINHLIHVLRKNWEGRRLCWRKLGQQAGLTVSGRTIQRALASEGYTRCKACKKPFMDKNCRKSRLQYSKEHLDKPIEWWRQHMYSDE
ncbi:hypothetical protein EDC01DRAFT_617712, partial [Geopyxis carbonaria]